MNRAHNARVEAVMAANLCLKITPLSYANSAEREQSAEIASGVGAIM